MISGSDLCWGGFLSLPPRPPVAPCFSSAARQLCGAHARTHARSCKGLRNARPGSPKRTAAARARPRRGNAKRGRLDLLGTKRTRPTRARVCERAGCTKEEKKKEQGRRWTECVVSDGRGKKPLGNVPRKRRFRSSRNPRTNRCARSVFSVTKSGGARETRIWRQWASADGGEGRSWDPPAGPEYHEIVLYNSHCH